MTSSASSTAPRTDLHSLSSGFVNSRWFEGLARSGFVARGLVYGIIGLLALKLALGSGGRAANQHGAMKALAAQPFGKVLLLLLAIGLAGYAGWRLTRAALGRGPEGADQGFDRVAALASGLVYAAFFVLALEVLTGSDSAKTGNPKTTTAGVLGWPAGTLLVVLAGAVFLGVAAYQVYRGVTRKFLEDSKTEEMRPEVQRWIARIGTVGHLARAIVFGIVGAFLIKAAVDYNGRTAVGLDGALAKVQQQAYGHFLLGLVACGLIAFAVYSMSDARYRRI
jgi:hypothetical protein